MKRNGSRRGRVVWIVVAIVLVAGGAVGATVVKRNGKAKHAAPVVKVERGDVIEKALAVGSIVPRDEISVKARVSGVVKKVYREPGQIVPAGAPLLEIQPDPTPLELADARRRIDLDEIARRNAEKELNRTRDMLTRGVVSDREYEAAEKAFETAQLQVVADRERLQLIEKGSVSIAGQEIEATVRAPIAGAILERNVNLGDPVVPLTSYQEGTVLMTMANMDSLIFKGTVDEIDVGKLAVGMPVEIRIGALPGQTVPGRLLRISLKAREENNTRMFPVEIAIERTGVTLLRAGYSANADIIIRRADKVLTLPERVVHSANDSTWVEIAGASGARVRTPITTGLSDAIRIEVTTGLTEGQEVLEKPEKTL
ncbi:MAG: efflux RND transporter periplasmic adaptor subunit [Candidatus Krumholzibacteriia bacterium]